MDPVEEAVRALRRGQPVLVFDDWRREAEVDYVVHASRVDSDVVYEMRTLAGGLICYAMPIEYGWMLGIDLMTRLLARYEPLSRLVKRPRYGDEPAFSLWVNSVDVETGIRDEDRAKTIRVLDEVNRMITENRVEEARETFYTRLMAPGHVPILLGRSLRERRGHTELSLALARLAGMRPSMVLAEMLSRGRQLSLEEAEKLARDYGYPLVSGREIARVST